MCEAHISDKCTGETAYKIPDGRRVCVECLPFVPGGDSIKGPASNFDRLMSMGEALGLAPPGMRYD